MLSGNELERGVKPGFDVVDEGAGGLMAMLWSEEGAGGGLLAMVESRFVEHNTLKYIIYPAALHKV